MISTATIFHKNSKIVIHKIVDEFVLVPVEEDVLLVNSIYSTNDVGGRIWELVDGVNTVQDIAQEIAAEYGIEEEVALRDVSEFMEVMLEKGCLL